MPELSITSSYFTLPGGSVTLSSLDFATATIISIKQTVFSKFGADCAVPVQNLWWNGYVLDDNLTVMDACVGFDKAEVINPKEDLVREFVERAEEKSERETSER